MHKAEQKKRRFFGLGGSSKEISKDKPEKVGRSTSVRRKDHAQKPEYHNTDARNRTEQQPWSAPNPLDDEEEPERYVIWRDSFLITTELGIRKHGSGGGLVVRLTP